MRVVNSNRTFRVYWMYSSAYLAALLAMANPEKLEEYENLPLRKQCELLGIPFEGLGVDNDITHCFLVEEGKDGPLAHSKVIRYYKDPNDKDKARKYALGKLLKEFFPTDKVVRTQFWEAYRNRVPVPPEVVTVARESL